MKSIKNQKGLSLVGVLISAGLIGGLALAVGKIMQNSNKILRTTEVGMETFDYEALLEDTFRNRDACTNTFGQVMNSVNPTVEDRPGTAPSSDNILTGNTLNGKTGILNASGEELWVFDEIVIGGLQLKSLKILPTRIKVDSTGAATTVTNFKEISPAPNKTGFYEVHVDLEKTGKSARSFGGRNKHIKFFLTAEVYDTDNKIEWCQLSGGGPTNSSSVKVESGQANHGDIIMPIFGYAKTDCHLNVGTGVPTKTDGSYKRSRHYGAYYKDSGTGGWLLKTGYRSIQTGGLSDVTNGLPQYVLICSN